MIARRIGCVGLALIIGSTPLVLSYKDQARAQVEVATIGAVVSGLRELVKELENSAHSLIEQGNNSLAQQQMLIAGILQKLTDQVLTNYSTALDRTVSSLSVQEQNVFNSISSIVDNVDELENKSFKDIQRAIYQSQGAVNQILDRLPLTKKVPLFFGLVSRDLLFDPSQNPSDIEILGFHLTDPSLNAKLPDVHVAGQKLSASNISVREDRLLIQIPDDVKEKIGFNSSPCEPRKTFSIKFGMFYSESRGFWPFSWNDEVRRDFSANALPGSDLFDVKIYYDGIRTTTAMKQESFRQRSGYTSMQCEQTVGAGVQFQLPPNSQEIQCAASWVETSNVKSQSQNCAVGGNVVTGTGSMTGRNRDCYVVGEVLGWVFRRKNVCNCPGGGHGTLEIAGTYKVSETKTESLNNAWVGNYVLRKNSNLSVLIPRDSSVSVKNLNVDIKRNDCQRVFDTISVSMGDPNQRVEHTSNQGKFESVLWNNQLKIQSRSN